MIILPIMINQFNYHCPSCKKQLNKDNEVEFLVERKNKENVIVFLSPTPHSYDYRMEPILVFTLNEEVTFICKHCNASLISKNYPKFIKIHLKITDKVLIDVFFSRLYGVHKTYFGLEDFEDIYGKEMSNL